MTWEGSEKEWSTASEREGGREGERERAREREREERRIYCRGECYSVTSKAHTLSFC